MKTNSGKIFYLTKHTNNNFVNAYFSVKRPNFFQDGSFEAHPVKEWYNFTPRVTYRTLNAEEAEEKFAERGKILNHFAIMVNIFETFLTRKLNLFIAIKWESHNSFFSHI